MDKMASVESIFIGCNRQLEIFDYHDKRRELAYGANNLVAVYKPFETGHRGVLRTLKHHTKEVTCVQWLPGTDLLISTSEDSTIAIWKDSALLQVLDIGHKSSVTCLATLNDRIFVTGDAEGSIIIWSVQADDTVVQSHSFNVKVGFLPLCLAFEEVGPGNFVLAIGGTNTLLYVYSFKLGSGIEDFKHCATLAGHEDWIKVIAFKKENDSSWLIASGSQDRYIRLWKLNINGAIDKTDEDSTKLMLLSNKQHKFTSGLTECAIHFDAIIMGHDDWISALKWHPEKVQLLSSSADTSIMLWEPDTVSGIWISTTRLGEISIKGASTATGASGGFWSAAWIFDSDKEYIFTNSKTGSLRLWESARDENNWSQKLTVTGSLKPSNDLSWSENGEYLLATSLDQTTRLFASWRQSSGVSSWHEFARPQIHGYDMICVSTLSSTRFISGGDEKILRSFDLPKSVSKMLNKLCGITLDSEEMPESASLPVLGLSNKAQTDQPEKSQEEIENDIEDADTVNHTNDILASLEQPPLEDVLQRHTLFPEIEKLYGHGYEITTVATSNDKSLIATSCRSNSVQHAVIRIFRASNWQQLDNPLKAHNLTVTRLAFSKDDAYLVGVSRDRQFSLWKRQDGGAFSLVKLMEKAHSRIIWDVVFTPLEFLAGRCFITVSRDKFIKLWEIQENDQVVLKSSLKHTDVITSCDCLKTVVDGKICVIVGTESGSIDWFAVDKDGSFVNVFSVDESDRPAGRINRIAFGTDSDNSGAIVFAVASDDCSVRIYSVKKDVLKLQGST